MNEIIFRGKMADSDEWIFGDLFQRTHKYIFPHGVYTAKIHRYCLEVEPETVGQHTNLYTYDGGSIYADDVISFTDFDEERTGGQTRNKTHLGFVEYDCGAYIIKTPDGYFDLYNVLANDEEAEVVGNIHDHPELMGGRLFFINESDEGEKQC